MDRNTDFEYKNTGIIFPRALLRFIVEFILQIFFDNNKSYCCLIIVFVHVCLQVVFSYNISH